MAFDPWAPSEGYVAEALALCYAVLSVVQSRVLPPILGTADAHGAPRWRCALSAQMQWAVLPACWFLETPTATRAFVYVFALYLLLDFVITQLSTLLVVHHVFCLLGHLIVAFALPATLPVYFAGVVALELGSGFFNLWCLRPDSEARALLYIVGMTISNAAACAVGYRWVQLDIPLAPKVLNTIISAIMVVMRQKACYKNIKGHRAKRD